MFPRGFGYLQGLGPVRVRGTGLLISADSVQYPPVLERPILRVKSTGSMTVRRRDATLPKRVSRPVLPPVGAALPARFGMGHFHGMETSFRMCGMERRTR